MKTVGQEFNFAYHEDSGCPATGSGEETSKNV